LSIVIFVPLERFYKIEPIEPGLARLLQMLRVGLDKTPSRAYGSPM
jgi:hypothetical protein